MPKIENRDSYLGLRFNSREKTDSSSGPAEFPVVEEMLAAIYEIPTDRPFTETNLKELRERFPNDKFSRRHRSSFDNKIDELWRRLNYHGQTSWSMGICNEISTHDQLLDIKRVIHLRRDEKVDHRRWGFYLTPGYSRNNLILGGHATDPAAALGDYRASAEALLHPRARLLELLRANVTVHPGNPTPKRPGLVSYSIGLTPEAASLCAQLMFNKIAAEGPTAFVGINNDAHALVGSLGAVAFQQGYAVKTFVLPEVGLEEKVARNSGLTCDDRIILVGKMGGSANFLNALGRLAAEKLKPLKAACVVDAYGAKSSLYKSGTELLCLFTREDLCPKA